MRKFLTLMIIASLIVSCKDKTEDVGTAAKGEFVTEKNLVDTMVLRKTDFNKQIISNGRLKAMQKSDLQFLVSGTISDIYVKNGDRVTTDRELAKLDRRQAERNLEQARLSLAQATLSFEEGLIGYGNGRDTTNIPSEYIKNQRIKSGYSNSVNNLRSAEEDMTNTILKAPFSGKIANLTAKPYEQTSGIFCTIIDDSKFEVEFNLLESEMSFIAVGNSVKVTPFTDQGNVYNGSITEINPYVDDKGQIMVRALVSNSTGKLMQGMNVKVVVENLTKNRLVVPKGAVVMRDNFDVLFRFNASTGRAMWTYVDVVMSNTEFHVVGANQEKNAELNEGDIVIISGNLNLADNSRVEIKK